MSKNALYEWRCRKCGTIGSGGDGVCVLGHKVEPLPFSDRPITKKPILISISNEDCGTIYANKNDKIPTWICEKHPEQEFDNGHKDQDGKECIGPGMPNPFLCRHEDAVYWNPYNKAVQCHRCGTQFTEMNPDCKDCPICNPRDSHWDRFMEGIIFLVPLAFGYLLVVAHCKGWFLAWLTI